jgi:hypothetical protein
METPFNPLNKIVKASVYCFLFLGLSSCDSKTVQHQPQDTTISQYCFDSLPLINNWEGKSFYEGGFSGLALMPGPDTVFITISDRGPNVPMLLASQSTGKDTKLFPIPDYSPVIMRFALRDGKLVFLDRKPLRFSDGTRPSGLPNASVSGQSEEIAWSNTKGTAIQSIRTGIDAEGLTLESDTTAWIADEYAPAIYQVSLSTGTILKEVTPHKNNTVPSLYLKRRPNRGFESVAKLPDGRILAILQSPPDWTGTDSLATSRLIPIFAYDPVTGKSVTYLYETSLVSGDLKAKDFKVSDAYAISNHELLIIETAERKKTRHRMIYHINLKTASDVSKWTTDLLAIERLPENATQALKLGYRVVEKSPIINLNTIKELDRFEKIEGLCLLDENTLALVNDNDFGIAPVNNADNFRFTGIPSCLTLIKLSHPIKPSSN